LAGLSGKGRAELFLAAALASHYQARATFALIFLGITYVTTFRENRIVALLGRIISPLLVASLGIIIVKGLLTAHVPVITTATAWEVFKFELYARL
jgi:branched-subunit amino acid permease